MKGKDLLNEDTAKAPPHWTTNNLLRTLRSEDFALIKPHLHHWHGGKGAVIYEPGDDVRHAYFPCGSSLIAFMVMMRDGRDVETALVGREGAAGGIVSNGRLPAFARANVLSEGNFLRIESAALEDAKAKSLTLRYLFTRYADCLLAQIFQSVACNAAHTIEQRAARWIMSAIDRTGGSELPMTQEQLAGMLGVGRSYVNRVLKQLKKEGILETRRGGLKVCDSSALQAAACECTEAVRKHFDEVLRGVYPEGK
ncbi:MAG: Crp/Fnr family transcriptional regulator [Sphingomonadaceae bacterium]